MIDSRRLWKERFSRYVSEIRRYLRYMLNDHLLFVLLIGLGAGAVMYEKWVQALSPHFPYAVVEAGIFAVLLAYSPIRTFLKEADIVFLLPAEKQLGSYIRCSFLFSLVVQACFLLLGLLAVAPLHFRFATVPLWSLALILWLLKGWNLFISWKETHLIDSKAKWIRNIGRIWLNSVAVYFVLMNAPFLFLLSLVGIMITITFYFMNATKQKALPWEQLILQEERAVMRFYRLANLFTDVPHLKEQAKRRRWLDLPLKFISMRKENAFRYLYARTFVRAGDYFGLYVRLTVIGCFLVYMVPNEYGKVITALFFLYATGVQLFALSRHHRGHVLIQLYPLPVATQKKALLQLLLWLLLLQNVLFSLVLAVSGLWTASLSLLVLGVVFSYWLLFMYLNHRWRRSL